MPLYEFQCGSCTTVREYLFKSFEAAVLSSVFCETCGTAMVRQPSAPASVVVQGFNAVNGYASPRTITTDHGHGLKTQVSGNFEAFADGLV